MSFELTSENKKDVTQQRGQLLVERSIIESSEQEVDLSKSLISEKSLEEIFKSANADDAALINLDASYFVPTTVEQWNTQTRLRSKIYHFNKTSVSCDCLIDEENNIFEKREFPRYLFNTITDLKNGKLVLIHIRTADGRMRVDVKDGKGVINPNLFDSQIDWDKHKDF